ncbi:OPT family small oligopeptide transporter [Spinellus fusiger]|nr:OPT family small oligopeptide transporter [Spinellus fusiger]
MSEPTYDYQSKQESTDNNEKTDINHYNEKEAYLKTELEGAGSSKSSIDYDKEDTDVSIVNQIASTEDDPNIIVLTFRSILVGLILACLGSSVNQLMSFKPVSTPLSNVFMLIIAYVVCNLWAKHLPSGGWLNPGPFTIKEHTIIYVIVSSANTSAYGTFAIAAQELYFSNAPSAVGSIFLLFATQLVGYGIAGQLRPFLVYPSHMIWPTTLPTLSFLKSLNTPGNESKYLTRFFFAIFGCAFVWEFIPQYMFPLLSGFSVICLAKRDSVWIQRLFGGVAVNEGLGILSLSFDWNNLAYYSPLVFPFYVQMNIYFGLLLIWIIVPVVYYYDVWHAQSFPMLSNGIFSRDPVTGLSSKYPQAQVLNPDNSLNSTKLEEIGRPYFATFYALQYIFTNFAVTAIISHVALFHGKDIFRIVKNILKRKSSRQMDIHNTLMAAYKEVPSWWYYTIFILGTALNIGIGYLNKSQLPWWGFILAIVLSSVLSLPLNMIIAITGNHLGLNVVTEMVCGFILPGYPVANMYFKTVGYNTIHQAALMGSDLKIGHYLKLPPRIVFLAQLLGTVVGCVFNYIVNHTIVETKRDILLNPSSSVWSGANPQSMNSAAITWGAIGPMFMFGPGTEYYFFLWAFVVGFALPVPVWLLHRYFPKVGFNYVNIPLILIGFCTLPGTSSSWITVSFIIILVTQFYIKRRYLKWYVKHNYLLSAALDSGASLMVFLLSMTVFGGGNGISYNFPTWGGNRQDLVKAGHYIDYCCADC